MSPTCQINLITTSLSEALLHSLWQGLLISVLLGLVLKLLSSASAHKRYLAASSALFLQIVLFGISFFYAYQQTESSVLITEQVGQATDLGLVLGQTVQEKDYINLFSSSFEAVMLFSREYHLLICVCWLVGTLLLSIRFAGGLLLVEKLKKSTCKVPAQWKKRMDELAKSMDIKQKICLVISEKVDVPSITGWLKPVVILPLSVIAQLPPDEIESILAHELAHIKRHDYLVSILQAMVEIVMFFNPFVWWVSNLINEEREHCCDDIAVKAMGNHTSYIYALANLTMNLSTNKTPVGQGVLAATGKKNSVIFRINRIMKNINKKEDTLFVKNKNVTGGIAAYFVVLLLASFTFIGSGNAQQKEASFSKTNFTTTDSVMKEVILYEIKSSTENETEPEIIFEERDNNTIIFSDSLKKTKVVVKSKFRIHTNDGEVLTIDEEPAETKVEFIANELHVVRLKGGKIKEDIDKKILEELDKKGIVIENAVGDETALISYETIQKIKSDSSKFTLIRVREKQDKNATSQDKPKPIYIIDGKRVEHIGLKEIDPNQIAKIEVLKGDNAIKIYGEDGKDGVIIISLKKDDNQKRIVGEVKVEFKSDDELIFFLEGEQITKNDFEKIDPKNIKKINVLKGDSAIKKYGDSDIKGVVEIYLKKKLIETTLPQSALPSEELEETVKEKVSVGSFKSGISVFPNPSSDIFNINFKLVNESKVKVSVHDLNGKEVGIIANESMAAGVHQLSWNAQGMAQGLYLVNIMKDGELFQQKIILD